MRKNIFAKFFILILLATLLLVGLSACSQENQLLFTEDEVVGRFADGMEIVSYSNAPPSATQFIQEKRIAKKIYVDSRVDGLHLTGLYAPAGETILVEISSKTAQMGHCLIINANTANESIYTLDSKKVIIKNTNGGILDLYLQKSEYLNEGLVEGQDYTFSVVITGCIESAYYRYGIDQPYENGFLQSANDNLEMISVLDCGNLRFYVQNTMVKNQKSLDLAMSWWRSAIENVNQILQLSYTNGYLAPMIVYFGDAESDFTKNYITVPESQASSVFDYKKLIAGEGYDLLKSVCNAKVLKAQADTNLLMVEDMGEVIADCVILNAIDKTVVLDEKLSIYADSYKSLDGLLQNNLDNEAKKVTIFTNLVHDFGLERCAELLKSCKYDASDMSEQDRWNNIYQKAQEYLKVDVARYLSFYDIQIPQNLQAQSTSQEYLPIQCNYALGRFSQNSQTGNIVKYGEKTNFDFNNSFVSVTEGWEFLSLEGTNGLWKETDFGIYEYTPSKDFLEDDFFITFKNGEQEVRLYAKITVNINVAVHEVFNNVSYRDVASAVKHYDKLPNPTIVKSVESAIVPKSNEIENANNYALSVTKGSLQVAESGIYTFYLKSAGLCQVDFGVKDYYFTMFTNALTVQQYTHELCYEVKLETGKNYQFSIYVLTIIGSGSASLAIKKPGESSEIKELNQEYLVYNGFTRTQQPNYVPPKTPIKGYNQEATIYNYLKNGEFEISTNLLIKNDSNIQNLVDNDQNTVFVGESPSAKYDIFVDFGQVTKLDFLKIDITNNMLDLSNLVSAKIYISNDNALYIQVAEKQLSKLKNEIKLDENTRYLKINFESTIPAICEIESLNIGKIFGKSLIVPNSSLLLEYRGVWSRKFNYLSVNGSVNINEENNCSIKFDFYGSAMSIFATVGEEFGNAKILIDNEEYAMDLFSNQTICGKRVFSVDFNENGYHTLKIIPAKNNKINIDYISYVYAEQPDKLPPSNGKIALAVIIPTLIFITLVGCVVADMIAKRNKNKRRNM